MLYVSLLVSALVAGLNPFLGQSVRGWLTGYGARFVAMLMFGTGYIWLVCPSLNGPLWGHWRLLLPMAGVNAFWSVCSWVLIDEEHLRGSHNRGRKAPSWQLLGYGLIAFLLLAPVGAGIMTWQAWQAQDYAAMVGDIEVVEGDLTTNVDTTHIRMVGVEQAKWKADKVLEDNEGSTYKIGKPSIQRVGGKLKWVLPLEYQGFYVWYRFGDQGIPGWIEVDAEDASKPATRVRSHNLVYATSAFWGQNLERHLYLNGYSGFDTEGFHLEVDDSGTPWWVVTLQNPTIQYFAPRIEGVLLVNPSTGEIHQHTVEELPKWVDRVVPEEVAAERVNWYGKFRSGIWVKWGSQNDLFAITQVKNHDEMWLTWGHGEDAEWFSGVTSLSGKDQAMTGIVTVDSRTGKVRLFKTQGDNEEAVLGRMNNGVSQYQGWHASDPIRYTLYGEPSWVCPIVSNGEFQALCIAHASKNVKAYGKDKESALRMYRLELQKQNEGVPSKEKKRGVEAEATVVRKAVDYRDGVAVYIFIFKEYPTKVFQGESRLSPKMPLAEPGDKVKIQFEDTGEELETLRAFQLNLQAK